MAFIPVAEWGDATTPFQLTGKDPIERRPGTDRLWEYAQEHHGFYGWLRVADARITRRTGVGLMDLPDRLWRDSYDAGRAPQRPARYAGGPVRHAALTRSAQLAPSPTLP